MIARRLLLLWWFVVPGILYAQFSPGELSRVHKELEGIDNCLQCHETGKEISGKKCLTCHKEITSAIDAKHGYHFTVAARQCVACHKEHLGRDAKTILFDKDAFDHSLTGFRRTGKHATVSCEECHAVKNIRDARVLDIIKNTARITYLGLSQACASCHADRHHATMGKECQTCHSTAAWRPAEGFDHARTEFRLRGKHVTVECSKCHTDTGRKEKDRPILFTTKPFADCTPCHQSPHNPGFVGSQKCATCHSEENWTVARASSKFNHDLTSFRLVGRHATVRCEQCHTPGSQVPGRRMKLAHNACSDCHSDYHRGEFGAGKKCESCHTPHGFRPSTYTIATHATSRFALTGAHRATPCERCHVPADDGRRHFRFVSIRCDACHKDVHNGQFTREMAERSCAACHTTEDWFPKNFDHGKTRFALTGKHATTACSNCHKPFLAGNVASARFKGLSGTCASCHKEVHAGQFALNGETECARCHTASGWKMLAFDHNTQSAFALTGAHTRVACRQCHREEGSGDARFVRYKPMSTQCESCHAQGRFGNN